MSAPTPPQNPQHVIKTPQELIHIKHSISLRQYKYWVIALRVFRDLHEAGQPLEPDGFYMFPISRITELIGYQPSRGELKADLSALRREAIAYNMLSKDRKEKIYAESGFISEFKVSTNWIRIKIPSFLEECVRNLDNKNSIFQALHWSVFDHFSGKHEANLYKLCKDYVGVGLTPRLTIAEFREYMGLKSHEYEEYKDLNKYVIGGPIKKVNESNISDITIWIPDDPENKNKVGRRVVAVQFAVKSRAQTVLDLGIDATFGAARVTISAAQRKKYLADKNSSEITASIVRANEYADAQEKSGKSVNFGALYKTAIYDDWGLEHQSKIAREEQLKEQSMTSQDAQSPAGPAEAPHDPAREKAMAAFENLPIADQKRRLELFAETLAAPLQQKYVSEGLGSVLVRKAFEAWLAKTG
jgi:hypothetical protein